MILTVLKNIYIVLQFLNLNWFLFEIKYLPGIPPSIEEPYGPYPLYVMNSKSNKTIPILQAYCNSKYMGKVNLKFDSSGNLLNITGSPILMDHKIKEGKFTIYSYNMWIYAKPSLKNHYFQVCITFIKNVSFYNHEIYIIILNNIACKKTLFRAQTIRLNRVKCKHGCIV